MVHSESSFSGNQAIPTVSKAGQPHANASAAAAASFKSAYIPKSPVRFRAARPLRNLCSQGLDAQTGGGVAGKHFANSGVLGEHLGLLVVGLAHDLAPAGSVHDCLSDPTGAQGVPFQNLATPFL